jgi:hypothetical protein
MDHDKNLTIEDVRQAIDINEIFGVWDAYYSPENCDLYFYGVKRGIPSISPLDTESHSVRVTIPNLRKFLSHLDEFHSSDVLEPHPRMP